MIKESAFPGSSVCCHKSGKDVAIITYGTMTDQAILSAESLEKQEISASVLRLLTVSPLPVDELVAQLGAIRKIVIAEEIAANSGIAAMLASRAFG